MSQSGTKKSGEKLIASNPAARSNYIIEEVVEAGVVLTGTEIKSIRASAPNIKDAFVEVYPSKKGFEAFMVNSHIALYSHGNIWNHQPTQRRKLLLHRHQLEKLYGYVIQKGMSIVPLRMYFKAGLVKVEIGVGRGKKKFDKRETIKKKVADREMDRAMKRR